MSYFSSRDLADEEGIRIHRNECPQYRLDPAPDAVREYRTEHRVIINNHRQKFGPSKQKKKKPVTGSNKENATSQNLPKLSDYLQNERKKPKTRERNSRAETSCLQEARLRN